MCCFLSLMSPLFLISSLSVPVRNEWSGTPLPGLRSKRCTACTGFCSLAFPYGERDYLRPSFDMDCLLALWPLLLLVSLVTCKVWPFDLYLKKLPCNTAYVLTQSSIKHPCSTWTWVLKFFFLSLFLADSLERGSLPSSFSCQGFPRLLKTS